MRDPASPQFRCGRFESALQEKHLGTHSATTHFNRFAFFLEFGQAATQTARGEFELSGPALHWGPIEPDTRLRIAAGSAGFYLFIGDQVLNDAIGLAEEASTLRRLSSQHVVTAIDTSDAFTKQLEALFSQIVQEAQTRQFGTDIAMAAHVRLLLISLWRNLQVGLEHSPGAVDGRGVINGFRQLVESHFRARWSAKRYARELGISYDRLHDNCLRAVGKPPALLIRERVLHEARVLLQRTSATNERVAATLGFSSASQFSHFFKSMSGETPGAYRKAAHARRDQPEEIVQFSDWP